jgi:uncharacterized Fe-S center protein
MPQEILFARYVPKNLEVKNSIGAKWERMLKKIDFASIVKDKRTAIKMHLGAEFGFTTIHPFFVRRLVQSAKKAGAKEVFVTDTHEAVQSAVDRGYTKEVVGCPIISITGTGENFYYTKALDPPFLTFKEVQMAGEIADAEALIDFSHIKGHGTCGFGGAAKNLAMGCYTKATRRAIHGLEGGLEWDSEKCTGCKKCMENCPTEAISFKEDGTWKVFYHDCKFCQHCVLVCPEDALVMEGGKYKDFQRGMALAISKVLETFNPENVLFINLLMNITILCDCWGMTTPALVPDIGILAGKDIVAIEQATLELIKTEDLIKKNIPRKLEIGEKGHLFERVHGKDPYAVLNYLIELGHRPADFKLVEVR